MPRSPRPRALALALVGLVATAGLVGCTAAGATQAGGSAAGGGSRPKVVIAYQKFPSGDLVVKHEGLLEKALPGYSIEWKAFDSGASINTAFIAKAVDIGAIGSSPVARGLSAPLNIPYSVAFVLDVAGRNEALVARKATGITSIAQLKGKRVATPFASTSHYSLLAALRGAGLSDSDVKLVDLQPQAIVAAWQRGDIDAAYVWLPSLDTLRATGTELTSSAELAKAGYPTLDLGVVSNALINAHPDVVDAWRKAEAQGVNTIKSQPAQAAAAIGAELGISADDASKQLAQGIFLTPAEQASTTWLGSEAAPGGVGKNLQQGAVFLADQKKIDAAPDLATFTKAVYTKGFADVTGS